MSDTFELGARVHLFTADTDLPLGPVASATIISEPLTTPKGSLVYRVKRRDGEVFLWPAEYLRLP